MKKRLEKLLLMGILTISIATSGVTGFAEEENAKLQTEVTEKETQPPTEAQTQAPTEAETQPPTEAETQPPTEAQTQPPTEAETQAPTETETQPPTEAQTQPSTESETQAPAESETQAAMESETETPAQSEISGGTMEESLGEAVEIIDNSIDEEKLQKIQKEVRKQEEEAAKKQEEEAKRLYELQIGESVIDFYAYPAGNITENTNKIYDYLTKEMGLNHAAACGVLANIQCESNFATTAVGDGGTSYGLCQWHLGRFSQLVNWCKANGLNYHLVDGQLSYLRHELETGYANVYQYISSVPDTAQGAYDAAYYWCMYYEIPSNTQARSIQRGNMAMEEFFPKELGTIPEEIDEEIKEEISAETGEKPEEKKETDETYNVLIIGDVNEETQVVTSLWQQIPEVAFQLSRLDIPKKSDLVWEQQGM